MRRFSSDWRNGKASPPDPASYLPDDPGRRPAALLALLRADLTLRREAGERARVERYLGRFPELPPEVLVALVYEEYCIREEAGEAPDPREYDTRFPAIAADVRELIDIHEFVDSSQDQLAGDAARVEKVPFPIAGETIGGFRLVEELGRGGMARVFLALERHLADRPVALKVSRAASREPQTLALLQHTHIVPVFSYHADAVTGLHLLCMPYFGRVTLADLLAAPQTISAQTGADLLAALDELGTPEQARPRADGREALAAHFRPGDRLVGSTPRRGAAIRPRLRSVAPRHQALQHTRHRRRDADVARLQSGAVERSGRPRTRQHRRNTGLHGTRAYRCAWPSFGMTLPGMTHGWTAGLTSIRSESCSTKLWALARFGGPSSTERHPANCAH